MSRFLLLLPLVFLAACQTTQPVDHPCGVLTDSLQNVDATTREGQERLDTHFERGFQAGCWKRVAGLPVLADPKPVTVIPVDSTTSKIVTVPLVPTPVKKPSLWQRVRSKL